MARKTLKIERTRNFVIQDFRNPPKSQVLGYRTIRRGRHLIRVAILKKPGPRGGRTRVTSVWHPKTERRSSNPRVTRALQAARRRRGRRRGRG